MRNDTFLMILNFMLAVILITICFICLAIGTAVAKVACIVCAMLLGFILAMAWRENERKRF